VSHGAVNFFEARQIPLANIACFPSKCLDSHLSNFPNLNAYFPPKKELLDGLSATLLQPDRRKGCGAPGTSGQLAHSHAKMKSRSFTTKLSFYLRSLPPNMGNLLSDSASPASGWITPQCSWNIPSLILMMPTTTIVDPSGFE
jgi:hypothetical protein